MYLKSKNFDEPPPPYFWILAMPLVCGINYAEPTAVLTDNADYEHYTVEQNDEDSKPRQAEWGANLPICIRRCRL